MPGPILRDGALLAFYRDGGRDLQGRTHAEILAWSDDLLEAVHDYIQWLFPLPEPSGVNPMAPLLTAAVIVEFHASPEMQRRLRAAWLRMLRFYGVSRGNDGGLVRAANYSIRTQVWLTPHNHNHLRLTRMLRCARLCGLPAESDALFSMLENLYAGEQGSPRPAISAETYGYWQRAMH